MDIKTKVYRLLCLGYSQRKIAIITSRSRQRISVITNRLLNDGYVYAINDNARPRIYKATDIRLPSIKKILVNNHRGWSVKPYHDICRAHLISFKVKFESEPLKPVKWDKAWTASGIKYFQMARLFDIGAVTIRLLESTREKILIFWLPEKFLKSDELNKWESFSFRYVDKIIRWFQKRYACILGIPEPYQKPHFAFIEDPLAVTLAKKYNVRSAETWLDNSEGLSEFETSNLETAKAKIELPTRVINLEEKIINLENSIEKITKTFDRLERKIDKVTDMFTLPPDKPDDRRRMYG